MANCCAKSLMIIINLLFWVIGLSLVVTSVYLLMSSASFFPVAKTESNFHVGAYSFFVIGLITLIMSFLGCCGAIKESRGMLITFFVTLFLVIVAEVAVVTWGIKNSDQLDTLVKNSAVEVVQQQYGVDNDRTQIYDTIQSHFQCCGAREPFDYALSKYNKVEVNILDFSISAPPIEYDLPKSCCVTNTTEEACNKARHVFVSAKWSSVINKKGCIDSLTDLLHQHSSCILIAVGVIILLELIGLILSLCLYCTVKNSDRYKS